MNSKTQYQKPASGTIVHRNAVHPDESKARGSVRRVRGRVPGRIALAVSSVVFLTGMVIAQRNDSLVVVGKSLYGDGDYSAAVAALNQVVVREQDNGTAQRYLGYALQGLGKHEEAIVHLKEAVKADSSNVGLLLALGRSLEAAGVPEEAEGIYRRCLRIDSKNMSALARVMQLSFDKKDWTEAARLARRLVGLDSTNSMNFLHLGLAELNRGNSEYAASVLQQAQRMSPANLNITLALSTVYLQLNLPESASRILTAGIQYHSTEQRLFRRAGDVWFKLHDFSKADSMFGQAVALGDSSATTLRLLGAAEVLHGKDDAARLHLVLAFERDSTDPLTPYYLGLALDKEDSVAAAVRWYEKAIELSDVVFIGQVLTQMSAIHERSGNMPAAVRDLKKALSVSTEQSQLSFQLASLYDRNYADPFVAVLYYRKFIQIASEKDSVLVDHAERRIRVLREREHFFRK